MDMRIFDETQEEAYRHNGDFELLTSLGLKTWGFRRDWTDLGTIVLLPAEDNEFGHKPETTIKVEVCAYPAQFWRFTITRPRDEVRDLDPDEPDHPYQQGNRERGRWIAAYEPVEQFVMTTGSGGFTNYWDTAKQIAGHWVDVEKTS